MRKGGVALCGAAVVLAFLFSGCVTFSGEPTAKQIGKTPRVAVSFKLCRWHPSTCPGEVNHPPTDSAWTDGHLLVGLRVPKGTKAPKSFSAQRIIGGEGNLRLVFNPTYTQELNRKAPRRKGERYVGYSSRPIATDVQQAGTVAAFRVVVRAPKRLLGKRFEVLPVLGWHARVGNGTHVNVNCAEPVFQKLDNGGGIDSWYSQCISAPLEGKLRPLAVRLKKGA
jgi:hypothetical protein